MKKEKGFTLVEVIVSFSLMSVVMIYLLKTIAVISTEQTNILTLENYSVYESTVLKKIYKDINNAYNIDVKEENNNIMIRIMSNILGSRNSESREHILHIKTATEMMLRQLVKVTDAYPLTEADIDSNKYSLIKKDNYYILKLNFIVNNKKEEMKVIVIN